MPKVLTGNDVVVRGGRAILPQGNAAVLCHAASVSGGMTHILQTLSAVKHINIVKVFEPEHGLLAALQDMVGSDGRYRDPYAGVEVISLYGRTKESLKPSPENLAGVDYVVADMADVGSRYYTFAATAAFCFERAASLGKPFYILDRPNPLDGITIEGPALRDGFESFVGAFKYCRTRHAMTMAELLRYYARVNGFSDELLRVIKMEGWSRGMTMPQTGVPFVAPSPNMPTYETARVYPGGCLIEGTLMSEGRGTTRPFETFGAPQIDPLKLLSALDSVALKGCVPRPCWFIPKFGKHADNLCGGFDIYVTNEREFSSIAFFAEVIMKTRRLYGSEVCAWRSHTYEFEDDIPAIDLLIGSTRLRRMIEDGVPIADQIEFWQTGEEARLFDEIRRDSLIY